jgi:hypothetical protein
MDEADASCKTDRDRLDLRHALGMIAPGRPHAMRLVSCFAIGFAVLAAPPAFACADRAERIRGAVQADIRTRNVAQTVGERLVTELNEAAAHCRAGRTAQGEAILTRIRNTYSYR